MNLFSSTRNASSKATKRVLTYFAIVTTFGFAHSAQGADGDLDTNFGTGGRVVTAVTDDSDLISAIAVQSDGKILVAGNSFTSPSNNDFVVARYNSDGTLDTTFSGDGIQFTSFGDSFDIAQAIAVQSDGKIIVAGTTFSGTNYDFAIARYNSDGSLDTTFSTDGKQTTDINGNDDLGNAIVIQSDGKIVVAGTQYPDANADFALVRYNSDGTLDTTFSGDGKLITDFNDSYDIANAAALQSDNKIVVVGVTDPSEGYTDFALARYNTDGSLDTSFSGDGKQTTDFNDSYEGISDVAIQGNGKIVAAGGTRPANGINDFALARYNSDGTLDTSFSGDGKQTTDFNGRVEAASSIALQSDGKIVAAGNSYSSTENFVVIDSDFALARYNTDGSLDTTFSSDGKLTTDFSEGSDFANALAIQNDGKIVAAGATRSSSSNDFALARYVVNLAPVANAGSDQSVPQQGIYTPVILNGTASSDANGDSLYYTWYDNDGTVIANGANPTVYLRQGVHTITLYVSDGELESSDTVQVNVFLPASTPNSSVNGNGFFKGENNSGQTSFWAAYNKNGLGGGLSYTDSSRKVNITSTQINAVVAQGNTARIYGFCKVNGMSGYEFVLTARDYLPTFIGQGDSFTLEVSNTNYTGGTFTKGDVKVVAPVLVR